MSASFHEVQFPTGISQGATGGPRFSTSVLALASGSEHRNINWQNRRGEWDVSTGLRTPEQAEELLDFFHGRRGRAYGFRFKDWGDYRLPRWRVSPGDMFSIPPLFTTDGVTPTVQIIKTYGDAAAHFVRLIQKPVSGSVVFYNGLTQLVEGPDFVVDYTTGIVTISNVLTATVGTVLSLACEFDVPARFDTDDMKLTVTTTENLAWSAIPVVEIPDI